MNETIFTEILTKHGFRVEKEQAVWSGGGDWYVAYIPSSKFSVAIAAYEPGDDTATICSELAVVKLPVKMKCKNTKEVDVEELEKTCVELNVKIKEIFNQLKLEQINTDF